MALAVQGNITNNEESEKCCIDIICFGISERSRKMNNSENYECILLEIADCETYRELVLNIDKESTHIINDAFNCLRNRILFNHLVDAITMALRREILHEISESTYVSLILSEHFVNDEISQISTVLRYMKDFAVREAFIGFRNLHRSGSYADIIKIHISEIIEEYEISRKLLAISVDGNVLSRVQLTALIKTVKSEFNCSYFVPWYFHGFGRVLLKSASSFAECEVFLKTISAMESFFRDKSKFNFLDEKKHVKEHKLINIKLRENKPFIVTLSDCIMDFIRVLNIIIELPKLLYSGDIVIATLFRKFLKELENVFFLKSFSHVFLDYFDCNYNFYPEVLDEKFPGKQFNTDKISEYPQHIQRFSKEGFNCVWEQVGNAVHELQTFLELKKPVYSNIFKKLSKHVDAEVSCRFDDMKRLAFCDLLNCSTEGLVFDRGLLPKLRSEQHLFFDHDAMESEIQKVESEKELFSNKTIYELPEMFTKSAPQLKKLAELVLTLPYLPPSRNMEDYKVQQIGYYSYLPKFTASPSGDISVLCLEQSILEDFKRSELFYDNVLEEFRRINKR